jgi:hypothetical protein
MGPVLQRTRSDLDINDKSPGCNNNMELCPRGNKRARLTESPKSKSPKPEASASQSAPVLAEPPALPAPPPRPNYHVSSSEDTKWGHRPRFQRENCNRKCCHGLIFNWICKGLTTHTLPPTFKKIKKDVLHIMDYISVKEAFANQRMRPQPYMILQVPPLLEAMARDWDSSCTYPFLKRACQELKSEVICTRSSGMKDDVDVVLSLACSGWANGGVSGPVPICPIVVQHRKLEDGNHKESNARLMKWMVSHFKSLEQNQLVSKRFDRPVPYFMVVGDMWTLGYAIKSENRIFLYEKCLQAVAWGEGIKRVAICLGHVVGLTAENFRGWVHAQEQKLKACQNGEFEEESEELDEFEESDELSDEEELDDEEEREVEEEHEVEAVLHAELLEG